jgi:hypothetical protein
MAMHELEHGRSESHTSCFAPPCAYTLGLRVELVSRVPKGLKQFVN